MHFAAPRCALRIHIEAKRSPQPQFCLLHAGFSVPAARSSSYILGNERIRGGPLLVSTSFLTPICIDLSNLSGLESCFCINNRVTILAGNCALQRFAAHGGAIHVTHIYRMHRT